MTTGHELEDLGALLHAHEQALHLRRTLGAYPRSDWRDWHEQALADSSWKVAAELARREGCVDAVREWADGRVLIGMRRPCLRCGEVIESGSYCAAHDPERTRRRNTPGRGTSTVARHFGEQVLARAGTAARW